MGSQIKLSLFTLLLAFCCLYYLNSRTEHFKSISDGVNKLEESAEKNEKRLKKFNLKEMEDKVEEMEKNLIDLRNILGLSNKS